MSDRQRGLRAGRWRAHAMVAVFLALVASPAAPGRAAPVTPAPLSSVADGYKVEATTTYTLDPPGDAIHVAIDLTVTNQTPDQVTASYVRQFYIPAFRVGVLSESVNLRATNSSGTVLSVSKEASDSQRFFYAVIDLQPNLYYPRSQTLRFTYDLPAVAPRSEGFTRLNDAYATFPMLALGDPGLATVEVVVPKGFEVEIVGDQMKESDREGQQVFTAAAIADPSAWFAQVAARDDSKLLERTVEVGDDEVRVLGWPDDAEWADFVATQVEDGVPAIEEVLGLEWPADATIDVVETASPYLYGYAGWYVRLDDLIEIGDDLDQQVILHELAHLWFNDTLFQERWVSEAFANQTAALAMAELGVAQPQPLAIDSADPGALPLNSWSRPDLQGERTDDQERYGYNASWAVLDEIVDEIGAEQLAVIVQQADAGRDAYFGPGDEERPTHVVTWKELLDLFEEVGGSEKAAALFEQHVVPADRAAELDERAAARLRYAELVDAGGGWAAPSSVRLAMSGWRFDSAEELVEGAMPVLATKDELLRVVAGLGVDDQLALQDSYERATRMDELQQVADEALAAGKALRSADQAEADGAGPLGAVGLLGSPVQADLADARAAFDRGDYDAVVEAAEAVESAMDQAPLTGLVRLVGVLVVIGLLLLLRRAWRGRRARRADPLEPLVEP